MSASPVSNGGSLHSAALGPAGDDDGGDDVGDHAAAAHDTEGRPKQADQRGVHVEILRNTAADTGDHPAGIGFVKTLIHMQFLLFFLRRRYQILNFFLLKQSSQILAENDHFQNDEDEESREMFIELNMFDLEQNRKPEGYNRKGKYRLIFPIGTMEFYLISLVAKPNDVKRVGDRIADILSTTNIKFETSRGDDEID